MPSTVAAADECVLATLPGSVERERMIVVLVRGAGSGTRIALRQQTFGDGVGWFTQKSVDLEPSQAALLKSALGGSTVVSRSHPRTASASSVGEFPRLYHVESA